ncbi:hypothetical protein V8E36_001309 [Tilletia maclaganii]
MVMLKPTFSLLSTALLLSASLNEVSGAPTPPRVRPFQGNAVTPGKGVAASGLGSNQFNNGPVFPAVQPLVNVNNTGDIARRQDPDASTYTDATGDSSTIAEDGTTAADDTVDAAYGSSDSDVNSFAADVVQSPPSAPVQPQALNLNWFLADTDTDSPEINFAGPGGPDDDGSLAESSSDSDTGAVSSATPNQYAGKAPTSNMQATEADATSPAWRAVPCNGEMFEGAGQKSSNANQYLVQPAAQASAAAATSPEFDDGQYHPGSLTASPSITAAKRSIYHRLGEDGKKKAGKKSKKTSKAGKKHRKSKKSKKTKKGGKKSKKSKKAPKKDAAPAAAPAKRSYNDQVLRVDGSGININLVGGDLDPSIYRHDDLIRLRTRTPSDHVHIHEHDDDWSDARHHSHHWREHHGESYRHGNYRGDNHVHVHEHGHHKRDLFAPGTRGTVAVLQPLVGSLLDTGLAQQVASLVLAPLSSVMGAVGGVTGGKGELNLATDTTATVTAGGAAAAAAAAQSFLLSPSSSQPGTKLMLVDSPNSVMTKPANMSDWRQVQLQATVFNLAAEAAAAAAAAVTAAATGAGASAPATMATAKDSGASPSGRFCATIDTRPPSTLRMELCNANSEGTSQEFLFDPATGQLTPFVDGSATTGSARIAGKRQAAADPSAAGSASGYGSGAGAGVSDAAPSSGAAASTPAASAASSSGPAPASVKLIFIADAPSTADAPPASATPSAADPASTSSAASTASTTAAAASATATDAMSAPVDQQSAAVDGSAVSDVVDDGSAYAASSSSSSATTAAPSSSAATSATDAASTAAASSTSAASPTSATADAPAGTTMNAMAVGAPAPQNFAVVAGSGSAAGSGVPMPQQYDTSDASSYGSADTPLIADTIDNSSSSAATTAVAGTSEGSAVADGGEEEDAAAASSGAGYVSGAATTPDESSAYGSATSGSTNPASAAVASLGGRRRSLTALVRRWFAPEMAVREV